MERKRETELEGQDCSKKLGHFIFFFQGRRKDGDFQNPGSGYHQGVIHSGSELQPLHFLCLGSRPLRRVHQGLAEAAGVFQTPVACFRQPPQSPGHLLPGLLASLVRRPCLPPQRERHLGELIQREDSPLGCRLKQEARTVVT